MEELQECPMCGGKLDTNLTCIGCNRTYQYDESGSWVTIPKKVIILKKPEIGDKITDILKIDENENNKSW